MQSDMSEAAKLRSLLKMMYDHGSWTALLCLQPCALSMRSRRRSKSSCIRSSSSRNASFIQVHGVSLSADRHKSGISSRSGSFSFASGCAAVAGDKRSSESGCESCSAVVMFTSAGLAAAAPSAASGASVEAATLTSLGSADVVGSVASIWLCAASTAPACASAAFPPPDVSDLGAAPLEDD